MALFEYGPTSERAMQYMDYGAFDRRLLWQAFVESMRARPYRTTAASRWLIWQTFGW